MRAHLALGSNLATRWGGPYETLLAAQQALRSRRDVRVQRASQIYRTAPVGLREQPDFANAVVEVETRLSPERLLTLCLRMERQFGRRRTIAGGPRTLDVDLLQVGSEIRSAPGLSLPHPRMHERRFVLVPLVEICPELWHPRLQASARELLARLPEGDVVSPWRELPGAKLATPEALPC